MDNKDIRFKIKMWSGILIISLTSFIFGMIWLYMTMKRTGVFLR